MSNVLSATPGNLIPTVTDAGSTGHRAYTVYPATINVADPALAALDGHTGQLSINSAGQLRGVVAAVAGSPFTVQPNLFQSVGATGRVVAPGAGVAIATIAAGSLPAGTYDIQVVASFDLGAPVAAAETNNMEFRRAAAAISALQVLPVINTYSGVRTFRMVLTGAEAVSVNAVGIATAGVGYNAQLIATRIA